MASEYQYANYSKQLASKNPYENYIKNSYTAGTAGNSVYVGPEKITQAQQTAQAMSPATTASGQNQIYSSPVNIQRQEGANDYKTFDPYQTNWGGEQLTDTQKNWISQLNINEGLKYTDPDRANEYAAANDAILQNINNVGHKAAYDSKSGTWYFDYDADMYVPDRGSGADDGSRGNFGNSFGTGLNGEEAQVRKLLNKTQNLAAQLEALEYTPLDINAEYRDSYDNAREIMNPQYQAAAERAATQSSENLAQSGIYDSLYGQALSANAMQQAEAAVDERALELARALLGYTQSENQYAADYRQNSLYSAGSLYNDSLANSINLLKSSRDYDTALRGLELEQQAINIDQALANSEISYQQAQQAMLELERQAMEQELSGAVGGGYYGGGDTPVQESLRDDPNYFLNMLAGARAAYTRGAINLMSYLWDAVEHKELTEDERDSIVAILDSEMAGN